MEKIIPCPARLRRVPRHFSWVDHRLVREGRIKGPGSEALGLYLLLVTVGDADGVSWYGTGSMGALLGMTSSRVERARSVLEEHDLVAFRRPFHQVLSLDGSPSHELAQSDGGAL